MVPQIAATMYQVDLVHLPVRYERHQVQLLFFDMSRKMYGGYQSLAFNAGNIEMFTVYGSGGSSRLQLMPDRFRIIEQNSGIKPDDFKARFEVAMSSAARVFNIMTFPLQTVKIRATSKPVLFENAIEFLANKICGFEDEDIESFARKPSAFTMSFSFLSTQDEENTVNVKVEAYEQPQQNVSMDVEGTFAAGITAEDLSLGAENIQKTLNFISEKTMAFLNRFDHEPGTEEPA